MGLSRLRLAASLAAPLAGALGAAACPLPPSKACQELVACQESVDPTVPVEEYGPGGDCWVNLSTAARCDEQCKVSLQALREATGDEQCGAGNG